MGSSSGAYNVAASMTFDLGHSPNAFLTSVLTMAVLAMGAEGWNLKRWVQYVYVVGDQRRLAALGFIPPVAHRRYGWYGGV